ncbi:Alpha/Beta hydrolase protein [Exophiala viscosa]|uniref:Alpha/Beta hydrolase protein n=1 Tax=Exophiala viscosa TaxID=2486360 RepID=UPI0021A174ED|nr:Alpha/Beta hydrolase protein [Exophiala viscosa]
MGRENIEFKNSDGVTLRGWFYTPENAGGGKLPTLVMAHGFTALKEMTLDFYAEHFTSAIPINCQPGGEIVPNLQISDYTDAITYASTRPEVDKDKIGVWGTSYSGGHVLVVAAVDRRVKVVLSQGPCVSGWDNFHRLVRPDIIPQLEELFNSNRIARSQGKEPAYLPIVHQDTFGTCALNGKDVYDFFMEWEKKSTWENRVTVRTMESFRGYEPQHLIEKISPTPLLLTVPTLDTLTPPDLSLAAYARAREPKELSLLPGGHFDSYAGKITEDNVARQIAFFKKWLVE